MRIALRNRSRTVALTTQPAPGMAAAPAPAPVPPVSLAAPAWWAAVAELTVPGEPDRAGEVRRWLREFVAGLESALAATDDSVLIISELVSNALRHSQSGLPGGEITVRAAFRPGVLRLEVIDQGGPWADRAGQEADDDAAAEWGRGLRIVASLATAWDVSGDCGSRTSWAEVSTASATARHAGF